MERIVKNKIGVETKIYAQTFEFEAYSQIKKLCNFEPYQNSKIRVMPDAHAGKGCVVGTTMTITDKVTPNLVGVDIGCIDCDTEFLTSSGWKKISMFSDGDDVLQYDKNSDTASFVLPIAYIVKDCEKLYHFKNSKGLDQVLSEDHKVVVWSGGKKRGYSINDYTARQIISLGDSLNKGYYGIKSSFKIKSDGIEISDNEIMLDVMVAADGCIRSVGASENKIELHLSKERKIVRAKQILDSCNIEYKFTELKNKTVNFYFNVGKNINKDLSKYWKANISQLAIVASESLLWDGHSGYRSYFSSTNKTSADVVQYAFSATDVRAGISTVEEIDKNWNTVFVVTPTKNNIIGITNTVSEYKPTDGKQYCFSVPTGYFVARRNGKIFITGNCGMLTTKIHTKTIDFHELDEIIRNEVPSGFDVHSSYKHKFDFDNLRCKKHVDIARAYQSIGTLGGGKCCFQPQLKQF